MWGGVLLGTTASLQGNIVNDATVGFSQSTDGVYAGNISGSGKLIKTGTGTVTLTGTNTYAGGTTVSGGVLLGTTTSPAGQHRQQCIGRLRARHRWRLCRQNLGHGWPDQDGCRQG